MRPLKNAQLRPILPSQIEKMKSEGYEPIQGGDASMANSDYFMVFVRGAGDNRMVEILCPSFLRGGLGFNARGGISY